MGMKADEESGDDESTNSGNTGTMEIEEEDGAEGEEEEQTSGPMNEQDAENDAGKTLSSAPSLSKSWAIEHAHVPIFTGGKICPFSLQQEEDSNSLPVPVPCLFLPVSGDLAIVDALRGTKLGAVREITGTLNRRTGAIDENDDDGDAGLDGDAITAYAFSNHQNILLTCNQNHLLQQYALKLASEKDDSAKDHPKTVSVVLEKTWGRSGHSLPVIDMEFHKSGVFVATASVDGTCRIFDFRGGHVTHIYRPLAGGSGGGSGRLSVTSIRWMDDTNHLVLAVGRDDGSIAIHDLRDKDMKRVVVLRDHLSAVTSMDWWWKGNTATNKEQSSFYPSVFVTAGRDAVINLWQISDNPQKPNGTKKSKNQNRDMGDAGRGVPAYQRAKTLPLYEEIEGMVLMPDEQDGSEDGCMRIATAGSKGVVRLWMSKLNREGEILALEKLAEQPVTQAYGKERGGHLRLELMNMQAQNRGIQLVVADAEHCLSFLSVSGRQDENLTTERTIVGFNDEVLDLKIIPSASANSEATHIVVATNSAQVRIFAMDTFSCHVLDGHTATVLCVDVSPCGRYIATCGKDNRMCLWHTESRKCIATAVGHTQAVGATALSRKKGLYSVAGKAARNGGGAFAVTVSLDRTLKRWNLPGGSELEKCAQSSSAKELSLDASFSSRAHEKDINVVSVAPNDSLVATGSQDKCAKLWRSSDLSLVATLRGHRRGVWDCQFSPYDRVIATASGDRSIRLWSLSDYSCVRTFQGHVASVLRVRFLVGGLQLLSSGADGLVKLWTIRTNECEATMDGHTDKVWALDVAPLGNTMISGGADSQILTWNDTTRVTDEAKRAEREESYLMDQRLANHLRHKEFAQALDIALTMDRPRLTLRVFTSIIETELKQNRDPKKCLQTYIAAWSIERVAQVLQCCRDWNTRARNCDVAMTVIRAIVSVLPAEDLGTNDSVGSILAGVTPYAERHFDRLEGLISNAYLLDFALFSMGSLSAPTEDDFSKWEAQSKLVLPPAHVDGKIQVGGQAIVGNRARDLDGSDVSVIGESDSSDDETDAGINRQEKGGDLVPDFDEDSSSSEQSPARGPVQSSGESSDSDDDSDGD